jgi:hypothetical protein
MPTQTRGTKTAAKPKAKAHSKRAARPAPAEKSQVRALAETVVDFPVGVLREVNGRLGELLESLDDRSRGARKTLEAQKSRARDLVDQVGERLSALR